MASSIADIRDVRFCVALGGDRLAIGWLYPMVAAAFKSGQSGRCASQDILASRLPSKARIWSALRIVRPISSRP